MSENSIWKRPFTLEQLNAGNKNTLGEQLGLEFTAFDNNTLTARMPVDPRTHQPMGLLHGGASAALAETLGSVGALLCLAPDSGKVPVGIELNASHLRGVRKGKPHSHRQNHAGLAN